MSHYHHETTQELANDKAGQIYARSLPKSCSCASTWAESQAGQTQTHRGSSAAWGSCSVLSVLLSWPFTSAPAGWASQVWAANTSPLVGRLALAACWMTACWLSVAKVTACSEILIWVGHSQYNEPHVTAVLDQHSTHSLTEERLLTLPS